MKYLYMLIAAVCISLAMPVDTASAAVVHQVDDEAKSLHVPATATTLCVTPMYVGVDVVFIVPQPVALAYYADKAVAVCVPVPQTITVFKQSYIKGRYRYRWHATTTGSNQVKT